jgi:hypothetical protein
MKKIWYQLSDNFDVSGVVMDITGVSAWIEGDMADLKPGEEIEKEYTIVPIWLTDEEFENLPEACI